jgi:hypothetical protein
MFVTALALSVAEVVVRLEEQTPEPEDVKAGWTALVLFLLLIAAVVLLAFSLVKQLRKAQAAEDAGVYGSNDKPAGSDADSDSGSGSDADAEPENHSTP